MGQQNFECLEAGPPPRGQAVQVHWPDGVLYDATFSGTNSQDMYTVSTTSRASRNSPAVYFWFVLIWFMLIYIIYISIY